MTDPVPDAQSAPTTRGRRSSALAQELSQVRPEEEEFAQGQVHRITDEPESMLSDLETPDSDVYAVIDDLIVVKVTHELPQGNGHQSWYTAGMTSRLDPDESPAEGLRRVQGVVSDHLMGTINDDWPVVGDLHGQVEAAIAQRMRTSRIVPQ